ncbi:hypothetical protein MaudCBS49596_006178 [Microsporum audouinii]
MARCGLDCDPFKCFRRKYKWTGDEEAVNVSDDSDKDSEQEPPQLPQLPPIDLDHIHLPGQHPPTPDPIHDITFAPTIPPGGPPPLHDRDYFVNGFACQEPSFRYPQREIGHQPKDAATGHHCCDVLTEAMQAMAEEKNEEYAMGYSPGPQASKGNSGSEDISELYPTVAADVRSIASKIVVPELEMIGYDDGSQVAFTVDIKPPPRPLGPNWKSAQVVDRVCKSLDRMMEVRAGIHRILREKPEYAVGFPYSIQEKKELEMKCLVTLNLFTNYMTEDSPFQQDKEPIRLLVTCFEIIVQCASASLAATRKAMENSKSQEEDDAIRHHFQRWVVQTWSDIWVLEDETSRYLGVPSINKPL